MKNNDLFVRSQVTFSVCPNHGRFALSVLVEYLWEKGSHKFHKDWATTNSTDSPFNAVVFIKWTQKLIIILIKGYACHGIILFQISEIKKSLPHLF